MAEGVRPVASLKTFFWRTASLQRETNSWRLRIWFCQNVVCSRSSQFSVRIISASTSVNDEPAALANLINAARNDLIASNESMFADVDMVPSFNDSMTQWLNESIQKHIVSLIHWVIGSLSLLQVFLDQGGLLVEELDVRVGGLEEGAEAFGGGFEGFHE